MAKGEKVTPREIDKFFKFLRDNQVLKEVEEYYERDLNEDGVPIDKFLKLKAEIPQDALTILFRWNKTSEGYKYWRTLHTKWCDVIEDEKSTEIRDVIILDYENNSIYIKKVPINIKTEKIDEYLKEEIKNIESCEWMLIDNTTRIDI